MPVDLRRLRSFLEEGPPEDVLRRMDYQLWRADESIAAEVAEQTYGWLAAVPDIEPDYEITILVLYVNRALPDLASTVPDSYFSRLYDGKTHDRYRITADDVAVELCFEMSHGERIEMNTYHDRIDFFVPTVHSYISHSLDHFE